MPAGKTPPPPGAKGNRSVVHGLISQLNDVQKRNQAAFIVPLDALSPNPNQPRRSYSAEAEAELTADIEARGILQPLLVRPHPNGKANNYQIVAGERRFRAASRAGLSEVPVVVQSLDDEQARAASLVENLQREALSPEDESMYFNMLIDEYNYSMRDIATMVNKSPMYVQRRVTLNKADEAQEAASSDASYENHNRNKMIRLSNSSQSAAKPKKFKLSTLEKFSRTLDETLQMPDTELAHDDQSREAIETTLQHIEDKIAQLRHKISPSAKRR